MNKKEPETSIVSGSFFGNNCYKLIYYSSLNVSAGLADAAL
jgi:hypothetical protein